MLNYAKMAQKIDALVPQWKESAIDLHERAAAAWEGITEDPLFADRVAQSNSSFLLPRWEGALGKALPISPMREAYACLAVDGSQIYPDRHTPYVPWCIINVGGMAVVYGEPHAQVELFSEPTVLPMQELHNIMDGTEHGNEIIDAVREQFELLEGAKRAIACKAANQKIPVVHLIDGTIIFWHLEGLETKSKKRLLGTYVAALEQLYQAGIPSAGYISYPHSRELVNLLRIGLCRYRSANCIPCHSTHTTFPCKSVDTLYDTIIAATFVPPYHRTTLFYSTSKIVAEYPAHLAPAFVYLHVGDEIARLEMPSWVAQDTKHRELVCAVALDQAVKGRGYPIALAEAHNQAVISHADKEVFLHLTKAYATAHRLPIVQTQKSLKKRFKSF